MNMVLKAGLAAMLATTVLTGAAIAETLRLSHNTGDTTTWQKGAERFGELLSEKTGGKYDVRVFPNAQLSGGDQMRQAEMVGRGALDLVVTSAINVTPLVPEMAVFSLPYLYAGYDQSMPRHRARLPICWSTSCAARGSRFWPGAKTAFVRSPTTSVRSSRPPT